MTTANHKDQRAAPARVDAPSGASPWACARQLAGTGRLKVHWHERLDLAPPPMPPGLDLADKVEGLLLGLAVGDVLGNTSESMSPSERQRDHGWISHYLPNRHAEGRPVGLPSDDTQMAFWTLEQRLADGRFDPDALGALFCTRPIYGIGRTVRAFQHNHQAGKAWADCGVPSSGNGALMRIAPVLLPYLRSPCPDLWGDTLLAAHLTHDDLLSNASCVALVNLLWRVMAMAVPPDPPWWLDT